MSVCGVHQVSLEFDDGIQPELLSEAKDQLISPQFGDLVILDQMHEYRNDGVVIYDCENVIDLDYEYDDYGHLPSKFRILEAPHHFPLNYWHSRSDGKRRIAHNVCVWYDYRKNADEILTSAKYLEEHCFESKFTAPDSKTYRFVYEFENEYEEMANPWIKDKLFLMKKTHQKIPEITPEWIEKMKEKLKQILSAEELLPLSLIPFTISEDEENTLYLSY